MPPILPPAIAEVQQITANPEPVLRNLQITQCYHELSLAMAALTGPLANWCTFATWASKQAGQSIRQEDLARTLERLIQDTPDAQQAAQATAAIALEVGGEQGRSVPGAAQALWQALNPLAAFSRVSDAVARGNRKVFGEIGYEFARFLALFSASQPSALQLEEFYAGLQPGDPPDGQRYLRQAFGRYHQALSEPNSKARAELMLLANIEIGFHEQTRLQPDILEAMEAPIYDPQQLRRQLMHELFPSPESRLHLWMAHLSGQARPVLDARDRFADEAQRLARLAVTEQMMTLGLPHGQVLRLGQDLRAGFSADLQQIDNPDLLALLRLIDPTPDSVAGTGAEDWSSLPDRLHFIADLFRARVHDGNLLGPPFNPQQVEALKANRRPEGRL